MTHLLGAKETAFALFLTLAAHAGLLFLTLA